MAHGGFASVLRKAYTAFGSPHQGKDKLTIDRILSSGAGFPGSEGKFSKASILKRSPNQQSLGIVPSIGESPVSSWETMRERKVNPKLKPGGGDKFHGSFLPRPNLQTKKLIKQFTPQHTELEFSKKIPLTQFTKTKRNINIEPLKPAVKAKLPSLVVDKSIQGDYKELFKSVRALQSTLTLDKVPETEIKETFSKLKKTVLKDKEVLANELGINTNKKMNPIPVSEFPKKDDSIRQLVVNENVNRKLLTSEEGKLMNLDPPARGGKSNLKPNALPDPRTNLKTNVTKPKLPISPASQVSLKPNKPAMPAPKRAQSKAPAPINQPPIKSKVPTYLSLDIENLVYDSKLGGTPRITQFAVSKFEDQLSPAMIPEGKELKLPELRKEITSRYGKGSETYFKSSLLDIKSAESALQTLEKGSIQDLVAEGSLKQEHIKRLQMQARNVSIGPKPMTATEFLKREIKQSLQASTRVEDGKRVFLPTYQKQAPMLGVDKVLGNWLDSEKNMVMEMEDYFKVLGKDKKHYKMLGHNVQLHDFDILKSTFHKYGLDLQQHIKHIPVQDTLMDSNISDRWLGALKRQGIDTAKMKLGGKGPMALENIVKATGINIGEVSRRFEHVSPVHDTNLEMAAKVFIEHADQNTLDLAAKQYKILAEQGETKLTNPLVTIPQKQQTIPIVEELLEGGIQSLKDGHVTRTPNMPAQVSQRGVFGSSKFSFTQLIDDVYGRGTMEELKAGGKAMVGAMDHVMSQVGPSLKRVALGTESYLSKLGIKSNMSGRNAAFIGLGLLGVAAGAAITFASAPFQSGGPNRPLTFNGQIRSMSADDQEHRMNTVEGVQAQKMRHQMTDFGSGYQGFVGSMLGHLKANLAKPNLSRKAFDGAAGVLSKSHRPQNPLITKPLETHGALNFTPKNNLKVNEVQIKSSTSSAKGLCESPNFKAQEIAARKAKIERKKKFRDLASGGTRSVFQANYNRIGHHQM